MLERSATDAVERAAAKGCGIIIKEALANGRLGSRNTSAAFLNKRKVLQAMAAKYNVEIDALCIAYVLQQSWAGVVLSGAATVPQLKSNLKSLEVELDNDDFKKMANMQENSANYWKERSQMNWN